MALCHISTKQYFHNKGLLLLMAKKKKTKNSPGRQDNKVVLIVCEGEVTEVTYFRSLRNEFAKQVNIEVIKGNGNDPKSILATAKRAYESSPTTYEQIFCVFDKDSHPHYQQVIKEIEQLCRNNMPIRAIHSAPCFEYWFLLHFEYTSSQFQRTEKKSAGDNCVKRLKKHIKSYDKTRLTMKEIFPQLYKKLDTAIKNAKRLQKDGKEHGFNDPYTNVNELIEYLHCL